MCFKWHFDSIHKYIKLKWTNRNVPDFYQGYNPTTHQDTYRAYEADRIDTNPNVAATHLDDTRLNKMILETAQILSTNNYLLNLSYKPYKLTHQNHPCTVWARQSAANTLWLIDYLYALCTEYKHRFNKEHKTSQHILPFYQALYAADPSVFPKTGLLPFAN